MRKPLGVLTLAISLCAAVSAAPVLDFAATPTDFGNNNSWSLGWEFNVLSPISVTALGMLDASLAGSLAWRSSHDVGIYDSAGNLLASATVTSGDPATGMFRYASITPILLGVGNGYRIAGATANDYFTPFGAGSVGIVVDPRIAFVADRYSQSSTLVFPTSSMGLPNAIFGPNFMAAPAPEPGSYALIAAGLGALALLRRKR